MQSRFKVLCSSLSLPTCAINISANNTRPTLLCVSLVDTETKIIFSGTLLKLMINLQIFQTSPTPGNKAKSHTCTMNSSRGRLLGYLVLLGTRKVVVKAKLIPVLLDVWMCSEGGQRSQSHAALMFDVPVIMLSRHLPLIMSLKMMNMHNGKRLVGCLQGLLNCAPRSPVYYVAFI